MINLSDTKVNDLYKRGFNYLRVLAVEWSDIDEALGRAFLKLCEGLDRVPESEHERTADKLWKTVVYQGSVDDYRQRRALTIPVDQETESGDIAHDYEATERAITVLRTVYTELEDDDIIVVLALVDNDFNIADTAEYLYEQRTNVYHMIKKVRQKVAHLLPEYFSAKRQSGIPQTRMAKHSGWSTFMSGVEYVASLDWDLHSATEVARVANSVNQNQLTGAPRARVPYGTVPGSTPSVRSMSLSDYENGYGE